MKHDYVSLLGAGNDERSLARCIVLAFDAQPALDRFLRGMISWQALRDEIASARKRPRDADIALRISLQRLDRMLGRADASATAILRSRLTQLWNLASADVQGYSLTLTEAGSDVDREHVARVLATESKVRSVILETVAPTTGFLDWPLQVGLPPSAQGRELKKRLLDARYRELFDPLLVGEEAKDVDLLLLPGSTYQPQVAGVGANTVIALGGPGATDRLQALTSQFSAGLAAACFVPRHEYVPWLESVVRELSHNRSLTDSLFLARLGASRRIEGGDPADLGAPLLLGDARFVRGSTIEASAKRVVSAVRALSLKHGTLVDASALPSMFNSTSIGGLGSELVEWIRATGWSSETGDAASLVQVRRAVESKVGTLKLEPLARVRPALDQRAPAARPPLAKLPRLPDVPKLVTIGTLPVSVKLPKLRLPPIPKLVTVLEPAKLAKLPPKIAKLAKMPRIDPPKPRRQAGIRPSPQMPFEEHARRVRRPPPEPSAVLQDEARRVQAVVRRADAGGRARSVKRLAAQTTYRIRLHIGTKKSGSAITAPIPFDESRLPPSRDGHDLTIVFWPLGDKKTSSPVRATVHLPVRGDSTLAEFEFRTGDEPRRFRARVIVMHANSALQTLLLRTPPERDDLAFDIENAYARDWRSADEERTDIALIAGEDSADAAGFVAAEESAVSFIEPDGIGRALSEIRTELSRANYDAVGAAGADLASDDCVRLLVKLALYGSTILENLRDLHPAAALEAARRVQVVEAVDSAYLPVEFFYSNKAPVGDAKLCPHALDALNDDALDGAAQDRCPNRDDEKFVCPLGFWGFTKCIERLPTSGATGHRFSVPRAGDDRLGPFTHALLAASERAASQMTGETGLPKITEAIIKNVHESHSWADWKAHAGKAPQQLMLLLPHSDDSPVAPGIPALEVSRQLLSSANLDADYVKPKRSDGKGPLVLLLGCGTAIAEIPFLNFARKFSRCGASVVLATLAVVHSTQAALLAQLMLGEIGRSSTSSIRLDEALLRIKRKLLASGNRLPLSVVAYGHSSWRI